MPYIPTGPNLFSHKRILLTMAGSLVVSSCSVKQSVNCSLRLHTQSVRVGVLLSKHIISVGM